MIGLRRGYFLQAQKLGDEKSVYIRSIPHYRLENYVLRTTRSQITKYWHASRG